MAQRRHFLLLLAVVSLFGRLAFAQVKSNTPEPYNPNSLPKLPFEPPLPTSVLPLSPAEAHPQDRTAPVPAVAPVTASFQEAVDLAGFVDRPANNFGPQAGFAWDPWGQGKTIRLCVPC